MIAFAGVTLALSYYSFKELQKRKSDTDLSLKIAAQGL